MRNLTIIALIVLSFSGYCQKVKYDLKEVPKQTNKIIIANSKTFEENYNYAGKMLVQNGYGLKSSNKEFGQFETTPKEMNRRRGVALGARNHIHMFICHTGLNPCFSGCCAWSLINPIDQVQF